MGRLRTAAAAAAIAACLPYAALKVAWLTGSSVGSATALGAASLHDGRHTAGNVATLAMELVAVMLAQSRSVTGADRSSRRRSCCIPVWVGTGLLAPVALGLPLGIIGAGDRRRISPRRPDNGLHGWVYAVVYGGFVVQAVALLTAFVLYARVRWAELLRLRMLEPAPGPTPRRLAGAGAGAAVVYAVANLAWAVAGESLGAPPNFDTAAQKSLLVSTGHPGAGRGIRRPSARPPTGACAGSRDRTAGGRRSRSAGSAARPRSRPGSASSRWPPTPARIRRRPSCSPSGPSAGR